MSVERKKVLEMLASGKISAEEAEKLLEKLEGSAANETASGEASGEKSGTEKKRPKYLRIVVDSPGKEQVNVRVPFSLVRANMKLVNILPERLTDRLADAGIAIGGIAAIRGLNDAAVLDDLNVEVEKPNGKKVRIFCE
jgi:polyhydroxyalkanoate synthesis regulator phasin